MQKRLWASLHPQWLWVCYVMCCNLSASGDVTSLDILVCICCSVSYYGDCTDQAPALRVLVVPRIVVMVSEDIQGFGVPNLLETSTWHCVKHVQQGEIASMLLLPFGIGAVIMLDKMQDIHMVYKHMLNFSFKLLFWWYCGVNAVAGTIPKQRKIQSTGHILWASFQRWLRCFSNYGTEATLAGKLEQNL